MDSWSYFSFLDKGNYYSLDFAAVFLALSAFSLAVPSVPLFQRLACHGKRRIGIEIVTAEGVAEMMNDVDLTILFSVPKSYFIHMYILGSFMGTCCYLYVLFAPMQSNRSSLNESILNSVAVQGMVMFVIHCLRRLLECIFITDYGSSTMNVSAYFVGIGHYILAPTCLLFALLQSDNESFQYEEKGKQRYFRILSLVLYSIGNISQFRHHKILFLLKKKQSHSTERTYSITNLKKCSGNSTASFGINDPISESVNANLDKNMNKNAEISCNIYDSRDSSSDLSDRNNQCKKHFYSLPEGIGFEYVSCPHYTAEILIYISFWILSLSSLSLFSMTLWVTCNLSVVADSQYLWYKKHFPEEMKKRKNWKRIFPCIW